MPGFYAPHLKLSQTSVVLTGDEFHHLCHVFRRKTGDAVLLTNGSGVRAGGVIQHLDKGSASISLDWTQEYEPAKPPMACAFALLRNKNDAIIIDKLTELGVRDLFPFTSDFTVRKSSSNTVGKFQAIAVSAIKQCDNAFLPRIHPVLPLAACLDTISAAHYVPCVAVETGKHDLLHDARDTGESTCVVIGPEGGFSPEEKALFAKNQLHTFSLGNHILRAETAAITSISQLLHINLINNPQYY